MSTRPYLEKPLHPDTGVCSLRENPRIDDPARRAARRTSGPRPGRRRTTEGRTNVARASCCFSIEAAVVALRPVRASWTGVTKPYRVVAPERVVIDHCSGHPRLVGRERHHLESGVGDS